MVDVYRVRAIQWPRSGRLLHGRQGVGGCSAVLQSAVCKGSILRLPLGGREPICKVHVYLGESPIMGRVLISIMLTLPQRIELLGVDGVDDPGPWHPWHLVA